MPRVCERQYSVGDHEFPLLRYSVVVSTPDSESGNPGSNPGTAKFRYSFFGCCNFIPAATCLMSFVFDPYSFLRYS